MIADFGNNIAGVFTNPVAAVAPSYTTTQPRQKFKES
jgi:hypothetical protein